jgi:hypothetical protein
MCPCPVHVLRTTILEDTSVSLLTLNDVCFNSMLSLFHFLSSQFSDTTLGVLLPQIFAAQVREHF